MKRILIIDDNPLNNKSFIQPLENFYQVDVVMSLKAAVRKLDIYSYSLVVLDIMMPTQEMGGDNEILTGFYFYDNIIKNNYPNIPILFWSNLLSDAFDDHFSSNKPDTVLFIHKTRKDRNHLIEKVNELLK